MYDYIIYIYIIYENFNINAGVNQPAFSIHF